MDTATEAQACHGLANLKVCATSRGYESVLEGLFWQRCRAVAYRVVAYRMKGSGLLMCLNVRYALEIPFRIDSRHAAGPGGCNSLTIHVILNIAARKNTGNTCPRSRVRHDVPVGVHFQLT